MPPELNTMPSADDPPLADFASSNSLRAANRPVVMLVEDDFMLRMSLSELLRSEGYLVECFANGVDALKRLEESSPKPGLILLDLMLPYMDGLDFRREQLSSSSSSDIPVVVITAIHLPKEDAAALRASRTFYKPLDVPALFQAMRELCPAGIA